MLYMEPVIAPFMSEITFRLCDLIGVMWENIIHTAAMDIHVLAKMLDTDAGTLNMPVSYTHLDVYKRQTVSCVWLLSTAASDT